MHLDYLFGDLGEAGIDFTQFARLIQQTRPMTPQQAWAFITGAQAALRLAIDNTPADTPGARQRRVDQLETLTKLRAAIGPIPDPVLEPIAQGVRDLVLRAFSEFNQIAEGKATLAAARSQIMGDLADSAKQLGQKAADLAGHVGDVLTVAAIAAALLAAYLVFRDKGR